MSQKTDDALIALRQISRATSSGSRKLAKASAISVSQLIALQEIRRADTLSPSRLAESMSLSRGTITILMRKLEARGLVMRAPDASDKRRHFFSLTPMGETVLDDAPEMLHEVFTASFGALPAWEQSMITAALERVAALIDADELDAAPILDTGEIS
jgi:DNA-binding MarR family transcriptional regulator